MTFFLKVPTHLKRGRSFTLKDDYGGKRSAVSVSLWRCSGLHKNPCQKFPAAVAVKTVQQSVVLNHLNRILTMMSFTMAPFLHFDSTTSTTGHQSMHFISKATIQTVAAVVHYFLLVFVFEWQDANCCACGKLKDFLLLKYLHTCLFFSRVNEWLTAIWMWCFSRFLWKTII